MQTDSKRVQVVQPAYVIETEAPVLGERAGQALALVFKPLNNWHVVFLQYAARDFGIAIPIVRMLLQAGTAQVQCAMHCVHSGEEKGCNRCMVWQIERSPYLQSE